MTPAKPGCANTAPTPGKMTLYFDLLLDLCSTTINRILVALYPSYFKLPGCYLRPVR